MDKGLKTNIIKSIHLEITGKCNLECVYCYNSQFNNKEKLDKEMSTEDIKRLINEASGMGCNSFTFSGGDPFLRNDIFEIIEYCKGRKVNFLTNGKKLTRDFIEKLSKYNQINEIKITLDGFDGHNKLRKGSNYLDILKSIKLLKKKKMKVVINTEVTELNLPEMNKLYDVLKKLKIDRWRVDLPFILGRYRENYKNFKLPEFKKFILTFKNILTDYLKKKPSFELELFNVFKSEITPTNLIQFNIDKHPCDYRTGSLPLRPNGDLVFCPSMDMPMSNFIKEGCLEKAMQKKHKNKFYDIKISNIKECQGCRYLKLCGTGCRVDSYYYLGDFKKPDPISCNLMPLIEKEIISIMPNNLRNFFLALINKEAKYPKKYRL
ncbi:MAG: radical SAM protein [Patescibacteria group bacterium]